MSTAANNTKPASPQLSRTASNVSQRLKGVFNRTPVARAASTASDSAQRSVASDFAANAAKQMANGVRATGHIAGKPPVATSDESKTKKQVEEKKISKPPVDEKKDTKPPVPSVKKPDNSDKPLPPAGGNAPVRAANALDFSALQPTIVPLMHGKSFEPEVLVQIRKFHYEELVRKFCSLPHGRGIILAGPTGCGKTTWALLPLFLQRHKHIILQPTAANCANVVYEFNHYMPVVGRRDDIPKFAFSYPESRICSNQVMTYAMFNEWVTRNGRLPDARMIVADEYHLMRQDVTTGLELLRNLPFRGRYIMASATPGHGIEVAKRDMTDDATFVDVALPEIMGLKSVEDTPYDPVRYRYTGLGLVCYAVASTVVSDHLFFMLALRGYRRIFQVDERMGLEQFVDMLRTQKPHDIYIMTPAVQAGITIPMDVFVISGQVSTVDYFDGIVTQRSRPHSAAEANQAEGRASRIRPTMIVRDLTATADAPDVSRDFYNANAAVILRAFGCDLRQSSLAEVTRVFPKLARLGSKAAGRAVAIAPVYPLTGAYYVDADGELYNFCGGKAKTFIADNINDLRMYRVGDVMFNAPFLDLTNNVDPSVWLPRQQQQRMSEAIAQQVVPVPDSVNEELLTTLRVNAHLFVDELISVMTGVCQEGGIGTKFKYDTEVNGVSVDQNTPEEPDTAKKILGKDESQLLPMLFGTDVAAVIVALVDNSPLRVFYDYHGRRDTDGYVAGVRFQLHHDGKFHKVGLTVESCKELGFWNTEKDQWDKQKYSAHLLKKMRPILATVWLSEKGSDRVVDLTRYSDEAVASGHSWLIKQLRI